VHRGRHIINGECRTALYLVDPGSNALNQVYPAAGFADQVAANGGKVAVFNLLRSDGDDEADFLFLGPCEETLPIALSMEKWLN
jgi:NAD-dependent SIR2 family protein deacetylase